jgi:hypothetical protein
MFDHDLRRVKGLEIRKTAEDGNCLFRAVADQVYGDAEAYDMARQMCVDYMVGFVFASSSNLLVYILLGQSYAYPVLLINKFNYQGSDTSCHASCLNTLHLFMNIRSLASIIVT